jgi:HK97 family phage major capsid protein
VTKNTFGGYVELSEQAVDFTDPAILSALLDDMGRVYANQTDNEAADNLVAGVTNTNAFTEANLNDPAYWASWIAEAASDILTGSDGNLPTHLFMNPGIWQYLLALSDTTDRPLFPQIGPMNAFGNLTPGTEQGNAFGLSVVVDKNFAAETLIIGDASGYEIYEQQKGAIQASNPASLSTTIAFRGYFATLMLDADKFVKASFA